MKAQKESLDIRDIEKIVINLQGLGMELKEAVYRLPGSVMKDYLLFETSKIIEFKTAHDFYYLQNKILRMIDLVIRWDLDREVLRLLEEISSEVRKIVKYIEMDRTGSED